jgi:hypothetical protein
LFLTSYTYLFDDFSSTEKTFFARESNDAAPHTGDAATMPTFDMLCAESIADAVLGRDGDVARRLRAETGASVELLAPPPHTTSLFAFEPADALVARRVPLPVKNRDVAVRVSCDDALSTAFSCPAQTCLFRLHARLAAVARHHDERGDASRFHKKKAPASNYGLDPAWQHGTEEPTTTQRTHIFFRVLAPRGACDYRSVRERTGASVRVAPYASRADTDLVVIDRHESRGECHVEAMRRVVASLGAFQHATRTSAAAFGFPFPFPVRDATRDRHEATHGDTQRRPAFTDDSSSRMTNDNDAPRSCESDVGYGYGYGYGARSSFPAGSRYARLEKNETRRDAFRFVSNDTPAREPEPPTVPTVPTVRMHLPVPTSLVRAVVGRGGANIQRVRAESGAKVKLHDCAPGAATRILELGGARRDVQAARALVVQCLERVFQENPDQDEF